MSDRLVLTLKQAAEELGVSERTVAGLVSRREIPTARVGRRVLIPTHLLREWLERRAAESAG